MYNSSVFYKKNLIESGKCKKIMSTLKLLVNADYET